MSEPLDLEPIKARLAAATPGQWVWLDHDLAPEGVEEVYNLDGTPHEWSGRCGIQTDQYDENDPATYSPDGVPVVMVLEMIEDEHDGTLYEIPINDADAALIVNAPTDIAALVAEVERLRARPAISPELAAGLDAWRDEDEEPSTFVLRMLVQVAQFGPPGALSKMLNDADW